VRLELPGSQSWPTIDRLVQDGINRHFGISVTRETEDVDVFVLTAGDGPSPGRRKHDEDPGGGAHTMYAAFSTVAFGASAETLSSDGPEWRDRLHSIGPLSLTETTIEEFGHWLEEIVGQPVVDETGLPGRYDIELQGELQGLDELRQALVQQLGLVLTRTKRQKEVLVVRHSAS
jgi:uncharacterized protein (TIGR03435 family)